MGLLFGCFACLLLYVQSTQAALTVTIPEGPIQARPGSDVLLRCYFEESSGHLDPKRLTVIWRVGTRDIVKYEDQLKVFRQGATMSPEELQQGNASLLLPNVQEADANAYTCFVIHSPDNEWKSIELKVEAPPLIKLGSTKVQLAKPNMVVCTATDFYPGNISMTWFRNDRIIQGPEQPPVQRNTGQLFTAKSVLKLIPEISDANANFSCHIRHQANEGPEVFNFHLQLQARPILQLLTKPQGERFVAAECNVSKFYPSQIRLQWLQNGVQQKYVKSETHLMPDGMFSISSVFFPQKSDVEVTYVCRAEHEALETPLEQAVLWRPEVTPTVPSTAVTPWLVGLAIGLVSGLALGAGIVYCKYKVKNNSVTGTPSEKKPLQDLDEEKIFDVSKFKTKETTSSGLKGEFPDMEEERL